MTFIAYLNDDLLSPILATQKSSYPELAISAIAILDARKLVGSRARFEVNNTLETHYSLFPMVDIARSVRNQSKV